MLRSSSLYSSLLFSLAVFMEKSGEQPLLSPGQLLKDEKGRPFKDPMREASSNEVVRAGESSSPDSQHSNQPVTKLTLRERDNGDEGRRSEDVHEIRKFHEIESPPIPGYLDTLISKAAGTGPEGTDSTQDTPAIGSTSLAEGQSIGLHRRPSAGMGQPFLHDKATIEPKQGTEVKEAIGQDVPVALTKSCYSLAIFGALTGAIAAIIAIVDGVKSQGFALHIPFSLHHTNIAWTLTLAGIQTLTLALLLGVTVLGVLPSSARVINQFAPLLCFLLAIFTAGISGLLGVCSAFLNVAAALLGTAAVVADKIEVAAKTQRHLERGDGPFQGLFHRESGKEEVKANQDIVS